ncbi:oligosaccharide flippase family protein [Scopulibacillus cellulosilyticus]|uniref:Oligosaccharide flippase family protein n=1 Tax=Scopulibacillus cellulosilyticus TaxID=2665665 RepID=A0ABW2PXJ8_9BACL
MIKNTWFMLITMGTQYASTTLIFFLLARIWDVNIFGDFMFGFVTSNLLILFVDYGFSLRLIKELSKSDYNKQNSLISNALVAKLILSLLISILVLIITIILNFNNTKLVIFMLLYVAAVFFSLTQFFLLPLRVINKFNIESKVNIIVNLVFLITIIILILFKCSPIMIAIGFVITRLIGLILSYRTCFSFFSFKKSYVSFNQIKRVLIINFPYAIQLIVSALYFQIDVVFIEWYMDSYNVGIQQAAMKIISGLLILTTIFSNVYLPYISKMDDYKEIHKVNKKFTFIMSSTGVLITIFVLIFARLIINFLYGKAYNEAINLLRLLSFLLFIRYSGVTYGVILTVLNKQMQRAFAVICALVFNVILNFVLVPTFGLKGAAISALSTGILLNIIYFSMVKTNKRHELLRKVV